MRTISKAKRISSNMKTIKKTINKKKLLIASCLVCALAVAAVVKIGVPGYRAFVEELEPQCDKIRRVGTIPYASRGEVKRTEILCNAFSDMSLRNHVLR